MPCRACVSWPLDTPSFATNCRTYCNLIASSQAPDGLAFLNSLLGYQRSGRMRDVRIAKTKSGSPPRPSAHQVVAPFGKKKDIETERKSSLGCGWRWPPGAAPHRSWTSAPTRSSGTSTWETGANAHGFQRPDIVGVGKLRSCLDV